MAFFSVRFAPRPVDLIEGLDVMEPADDLLTVVATITPTQNRGQRCYEIGVQVFARHDAVYAIYLTDTTTTGRIDLSHAKGAFRLRWHNPSRGAPAK